MQLHTAKTTRDGIPPHVAAHSHKPRHSAARLGIPRTCRGMLHHSTHSAARRYTQRHTTNHSGTSLNAAAHRHRQRVAAHRQRQGVTAHRHTSRHIAEHGASRRTATGRDTPPPNSYRAVSSRAAPCDVVQHPSQGAIVQAPARKLRRNYQNAPPNGLPRWVASMTSLTRRGSKDIGANACACVVAKPDAGLAA